MEQKNKKVVIIGAGMAGLSAAIKLLENGFSCAVLESESQPGGLARNFKIENKYFSIGYHHILKNDKPLLKMIDKVGLSGNIRWETQKAVFSVNGKIYNLINPVDFIKFPLPIFDKLRFVALMVHCFLKTNWTRNLGNARQWLDEIAGENTRKTVFDSLTDIKYGLPSEYLSANWLGSRLHTQEFSKPLGYIPDKDWTKDLIDKMAERIKKLGGEIILNAQVKKVLTGQNKFSGIVYSSNKQEKTILGDLLVSTVPPHVFLPLCDYRDSKMEKIEYLDAISLILETDQKLPRDFYLLSCLQPRYPFGGIFVLSKLNKTIGLKNGTVLNFFTNLNPQNDYLKNKTAKELLEIYQNDFEKLFGFRLKPNWSYFSFIKNYSPKFLNGYENPDIQGNIENIYFAGNYMTYPLITSTGSAIASGEKTAELIIKNYV
ncbi:MAG: FAD-dependent oxidoreductase [Candidatus Pacebacteria bacterium]|nr:FAD-dependent oxidoreductase [Candidatus Paceibacterota bacterium]